MRMARRIPQRSPSLAAGGGYDDVSANVSVSVNENDSIGLTLSASSLRFTEGGSTTGSFTAVLDSRPSADVRVEVSSSDPDVTFDTDAVTAGNQSALSFSQSNWSTPQTVTVAAPADDQNGSDERATITLNASNGGYSGQSGSVAVTVVDDDTIGLQLSRTARGLSEGESGTFTVQLMTQPLGDVTVSVTSSDTNAVTAMPATLTFTAADWDEAQTVTVQAKGDSDIADERVTVALSAAGGDYSDQNASFLVQVTDDDDTGLATSVDSLSLTEASARNSGSFTVALGSRPSATVTVELTSGKATAVQVIPSSLSFSRAAFRIPQTVNVVAFSDEDVGDESVTISLRSAGGDYQGVSSSLQVTVEDDDDPAFRLSTTSLTVTEGSTNTFDVRLVAQPTGDVTVAVASQSDAIATSAPAQPELQPEKLVRTPGCDRDRGSGCRQQR